MDFYSVATIYSRSDQLDCYYATLIGEGAILSDFRLPPTAFFFLINFIFLFCNLFPDSLGSEWR